MNKNTLALSLSLIVLISLPLHAQSGAINEGYDYDGKAIVALLPFIGEEDAADVFNAAAADAITALRKYNPRKISAATVRDAGVRIPTDMPPVAELTLGSRYALTGGVYPGNYEDEYYLQLWLWDMSNSTMIYTDDLVYDDLNTALESLPGLVEWLFSHITEKVVESVPVEKGWKDTMINLGFRSGISRHSYTEPDEAAPGANSLSYEGDIFLSVFLNSLISLQAEIDFTFDDLIYRSIANTSTVPGDYTPGLANEKYSTFSMMFPLLIKFNFKPGKFRLGPFAGIYAFLPLGDASYRKNPTDESGSFSWSVDVPMGFTIGIDGAMKLGPGMLIADLRYSGDFGLTTIDYGSKTIHDLTETSYRRGMFSITLGYAFGFIDIKK
jgi:hypothetical protein